jgi:threonine dehydrogenase-like Zn-dependent dehydrogenase
LLRRKVIDAEKIISHRFPLERIKEAFEIASKGGREVCKVVVGAY